MIRRQVFVAVLMVGLTAPVAAQRREVTETADIQRLRDSAYLVERDVAALNPRDAARAGQFHVRLACAWTRPCRCTRLDKSKAAEAMCRLVCCR